MREANSFDIFLLVLLGIIWGSSFFNIKIATYSYEPITLALVRVIFASAPLILLCKFKKIKIEAFSNVWKHYALIGLCNIAIPFILIAIGTSKINSYLAAMLMSTTPLSGTILAHFFTKNEKINIFKVIGVLVGFSGILFLFLDKIIINESNYIFALITILGSTFYSIGGILTIKIKNKGNENVTTSTTIWSLIFLFPMAIILEKPWLSDPSLESTLSLLYLGIVATGLAWTPFGGDILFIEASVSPGSGKIQITGQLGDVMKESAQLALSYLKAHSKQLKIPENAFTHWDVHLHVPAGATPKDGPSAGISILSALASIYTQRKVKGDIALTGEITLRGLVLAVGGIKEKVLAAKRAGIKEVVLPSKNEKDVAEIEQDVIEDLTISYVEKMDQVLPKLLEKTSINKPFEFFERPDIVKK